MKIEGIEPIEILHKLIELKPLKHDFDMEDEPEPTQNAVPTSIDASNAKLINKHVRQLIKHSLFELQPFSTGCDGNRRSLAVSSRTTWQGQ